MSKRIRARGDKALAEDLGTIFAEFYIAFGHAVRTTLKNRKKARSAGIKLWESLPPDKRYEFLSQNHSLVADAFREALVGEFRKQAKKHLDFTAKDFAHIKKATAGNPDISGSFGGTTTNGTALVGPTITIKDRSAQITIGAGPEVDYQGVKKGILSGEEIGDVAGKAVKGAGVWIGIKIEC